MRLAAILRIFHLSTIILGFCCIEYTVCDAEAGQGLPYSLGLTGTMLPVLGGTGGVGGFGCINDFITIEGGSEVCGAPTFFSKFCGDALSTYIAGAPPVDNAPICGKLMSQCNIQ